MMTCVPAPGAGAGTGTVAAAFTSAVSWAIWVACTVTCVFCAFFISTTSAVMVVLATVADANVLGRLLTIELLSLLSVFNFQILGLERRGVLRD